jgi:hypothetical protein
MENVRSLDIPDSATAQQKHDKQDKKNHNLSIFPIRTIILRFALFTF